MDRRWSMHDIPLQDMRHRAFTQEHSRRIERIEAGVEDSATSTQLRGQQTSSDQGDANMSKDVLDLHDPQQ